MAQYEQHFRARHFARVFQTAKHMVVYDIAGHTTDEQVSDPLVENVFHRYAAVDTGEDDGFGELPFETGHGLSIEVTRELFVGHISGIALLQAYKYSFGSQSLLNVLREYLADPSLYGGGRSVGFCLRSLVAACYKHCHCSREQNDLLHNLFVVNDE